MMRLRLTTALAAVALLAVPALAAQVTVSQKDKLFSESELALKNGDSVRFTNEDSVTHNISVRDPDGTNHSGQVEAPGAELLVTFDQLGDYQIRCLIHPKMKLVVHVE